MSDYLLSQKEYVRLKTRLTRKKNAFEKAKKDGNYDEAVKAAKALTEEKDYAQRIFQEKGYPDSHHDWERADDDAKSYIQYANPSHTIFRR